jgi:hypothetical protein
MLAAVPFTSNIVRAAVVLPAKEFTVKTVVLITRYPAPGMVTSTKRLLLPPIDAPPVVVTIGDTSESLCPVLDVIDPSNLAQYPLTELLVRDPEAVNLIFKLVPEGASIL